MGPTKRPLSERFWSHVDTMGPVVRAKLGRCWKWIGAMKDNGYGAFGDGTGGRATRTTAYAHRVAYRLQNGPIPAGKIVMHKCDNRSCVRGSHLIAGSQSDNIRDMVAKGRRKEYDRRGENNPNVVLNPDAVATIRALRKQGRTLTSLAADFGVGTSAVHRIVTRKSWTEVQP